MRKIRLARMVPAAAVIFGLGLTGCAPQQSEYSSDVAAALQSQVLAVSTASAGAEFAAAIGSLDELEVQLKDALARGEVTQERYDSIMAATALVRSDLQAAIDAQAPPVSDDEGDGDDDGDDEKDNNGNKGKGKSED